MKLEELYDQLDKQSVVIKHHEMSKDERKDFAKFYKNHRNAILFHRYLEEKFIFSFN